MIVIYMLTNKTNGRSYVGQTTNLDMRLKTHYYKGQTPVEKAWREVGRDGFFYTVLTTTKDYHEAHDLERFYIDKYDTMMPNGYNVRYGVPRDRQKYCGCCEGAESHEVDYINV